MLRLEKRAASDPQEPYEFLVCASAAAFGDICTNTVDCSDQLLADRITGKRVPPLRDTPDFIGKLFCYLIDAEIFKVYAVP